MLHQPLKEPPPSRAAQRLRTLLANSYERLSLVWHGWRHGRSRTSARRVEAGLVLLDDGSRKIHVPQLRSSLAFGDGIGARLDAVAGKYLGGAAYVPGPGNVVIDIGAGIGEFTIWCADHGAGVIAFEPDPLAFACLERNIVALSNVQIHPYALWKERTKLRLYGSADTTESSLIEDEGSRGRGADVEAWPLDGLEFLTRLAMIDLIKIDGEGVEPEIILAAPRTLRRTRIVAVDVGASARRPNLRARVEAALAAQNFRIVDHGRKDTILALNAAMVGPLNNRVLGRRGS
jgi:FkbM family methyltransferase